MEKAISNDAFNVDDNRKSLFEMIQNFNLGHFLSHPVTEDDEIVISGISGQFPCSENVNELYNNLLAKRNLVVEMDSRRWSSVDPELVNMAGLINEIDKFDCGLFGMHYNDAQDVNPSLRIYMEESLKAIMDAGVHPEELEGTKTGVFTSSSEVSYRREARVFKTKIYRNSMSTSISHFLRTKGPSLTIDAACGASGATLEHAFRALRTGECDYAIVGGGNVFQHPGVTFQFRQYGVLNSDGKCKVFDENVDGYVRSEGMACLFLQKRKTARRVYAKILHVKTNYDGTCSEGITVPSSESQYRLISEVHNEASINVDDLAFCEFHGTGTKVGDVQELKGVDSSIAQRRSKPLLIGSVKSNLGHTEGASGLTSVIKVLLAMENEMIPPNINLKKLNPNSEALMSGRLVVATEPKPLPLNSLVAVNNFGIGGSNSHTILKGITKRRQCENMFPRIVCASGRTPEAIKLLFSKAGNFDYASLLDQLFAKNYTTHPYRGYIIVRKDANPTETISLCSNIVNTLNIEFGQITSVDEDFISHSFVSDFISDIGNKLHSANQRLEMNNFKQIDDIYSLILNLCLVKVIKKLDLKPYQIQGKYEICAYFERKISLDDILKLYSTNPQQTLGHESRAKLKNSTLLMSSKLASNFYETIGSIYLLGFQPQIKNLYPSKFPVGRGTPSISSLLKFRHEKEWKTSLYGTNPSHIHRLDFALDLKSDGYKYLSGHVINGQIFFPAMGYCFLVWELLALNKQVLMADVPVIFENCRFIKVVILHENTPTKLTVTLSQSTGKYEIVNSGSVVLCGIIYEGRENMPELESFKNEEQIFLEEQDIYREFQLRGYEYRAPFTSLFQYNIAGTNAIAKWNKNWVAFLDSMLQAYLLSINIQSIYLPTSIERMSIDPEKHYKSFENAGQKVPFKIYKECSFLSSEGVKMQELSVWPISRKQQLDKPVLDKFVFIQNEFKSTHRDSILINIQIIRENFPEIKLKCVELITDPEKPKTFLITEIKKILEATVIANLEFSISSKYDLGEIDENYVVEPEGLEMESFSHLIIGRRILEDKEVLTNVMQALKPGGFILSSEKSDSNIETRDFEIITIHSIADSKFILCRKLHKYWPNEFEVILIMNVHLNWLPKLQTARKMDQNIILLSETEDPTGLLGLFRCLRQEPSLGKLVCFICENTSQFPTEFHKKQLRKQLSVNIYRNLKWGTFRYLPIEENPEIKSEHCHVTTQRPGDISNLKWYQAPKPTLDEMAEIYCSGLNFKDIVIASRRLNLKKEQGLMDYQIGSEFAGRDSSGKRVMGFVLEGGLGTSVQIQKDRTIEIPHHWSYEDAATVPVVYMTVLYALLMRIKLNKNMSVLIHSGAGGVGLAAINTASYYGCNIFVTVGTEEKRRFLKDNYPELPDNHIGKSRDISFEQWIKRETGGRGVDVILNSLFEDKLQASIRSLAEDGTLLELGKYDLIKNNPLALEPMKYGKCYHGIMLDRLYETSFAEETEELLKLIIFGIEKGFVKPLPRTVFKTEQIHEAFRLMMSGKHIGKVVVKIRDENEPKLKLGVVPRFYASFHRCSYIIIGGLGGMGLELANWLILRGAMNIVINSRNGIKTGYQAFRINCWKSSGVVIEISTHDVTTREGCIKLIKEAQRFGPVDGIFNLALVLQDGLLISQTKESFENVLKPKAIATQHLDRVSRMFCPNLKYFVVFSSLSCGFGNAGQSNYGMANSIMEHLCETRKKDGLPALAIQWGAIANVGVLAYSSLGKKIAEKYNAVPQKISSCLDVLDTVLQQDHAIVSSLILANKKNHENIANKSAVEAVLLALGVRSVSSQATLGELGMDSMNLIEILRILESDFQIVLGREKLHALTLARLSQLENEQKKPRKPGLLVP